MIVTPAKENAKQALDPLTRRDVLHHADARPELAEPKRFVLAVLTEH